MAIQRKKNPHGPELAYDDASGVKLIEKDGLYFKDLAKDGSLHPYEDWRLPTEERAIDLAKRLSVEQIAGLMLYSAHQAVPSSGPFGGATYDGKLFADSQAKASDLSDQQKAFMEKDQVRHILLTSVSSTCDAVEWSNNIQAWAESLPFGVPANICSDPRHGADASTEFNVGAGGGTSQWPESIGLAATFDPELVKEFGEIASREYRALGLVTTLSPQCDLATEPRWFRFSGTFGEGAKLSADLTRAYCDGFQTSEKNHEIEDGWGYESVNTMVKHWPGGGCGEGGRDAHFGCGKFSVFPGNNFAYHLKPFTEGAFALDGKTRMASAVMPYYTVDYEQDTKNHENVGCGYSQYLITDLLREKYHYNGVLCTDWNIITDETEPDVLMSGKCWGVEHLTIGERCLKILMAGVDQFGGVNDATPILDAYRLGCAQFGEAFMRKRMETSAVRILKNMFRTGIFENPYLDPDKSLAEVGSPDKVSKGYEAQQKSLVLLKNKNQLLPLRKETKIYIPKRFDPPRRDWFGNRTEGKWTYPSGYETVKEQFTIVDTPEEADAALCCIEAPGVNDMVRGYDREDKASGGNGYVPISLQYRPYTAKNAREVSLAGVERHGESANRSYKDKTTRTTNESDLDLVLETKEQMGEKPVIVYVYAWGPMVMKELEPVADALIYGFGPSLRPVADLIYGNFTPSGLLPMQLPADMDTVETQMEDVPFDMNSYADEDGHSYDYAYGLNWDGQIKDARVDRYGKRKN